MLAGQWECPCVLLRDGSEEAAQGDEGAEAASHLEVPRAERTRRIDSLLFADLGLSRGLLKSEIANCIFCDAVIPVQLRYIVPVHTGDAAPVLFVDSLILSGSNVIFSQEARCVSYACPIRGRHVFYRMPPSPPTGGPELLLSSFQTKEYALFYYFVMWISQIRSI